MLITFEGVDGSGKTTQTKKLAEYLKELKFDVVLTREPGGTPVAEEIRSLVLNNELNDYSQFFLFQAARYEHINNLIKPSLDEGKIVICDRFIDSTKVYQKINENFLSLCNSELTVYPTITFLIDIPPSLAFERSRNRKVSDIFDNNDLEFYEHIQKKFLKIAFENTSRFEIIDGYGSEASVFKKIKNNKKLDKCLSDMIYRKQFLTSN